jgi:hypothetical protein
MELRFPKDVCGIIWKYTIDFYRIDHNKRFIACIIEMDACCSGYTIRKYSFQTLGRPRDPERLGGRRCTCDFWIREQDCCLCDKPGLCEKPRCDVMDLQEYWENIEISRSTFRADYRVLCITSLSSRHVNRLDINSWTKVLPKDNSVWDIIVARIRHIKRFKACIIEMNARFSGYT